MRQRQPSVILLILWMGVAIGCALAAPSRELVLDDNLKSLAADIKYQNDRFLVIYHAPTRSPGPLDQSVIVFDKTFSRQFERYPGYDIPDVKTITLVDAAVSSDGLLVVAAHVWSSLKQAANVLFVYDLAKKDLVRIIRLNPIACVRVSVDYGNALWCLGMDVQKRDTLHQDYNLVYRFSWDGVLEGKYVLRSSLPNNGQVGPQPQEPFIVGKLGSPQIVPSGGGVLIWLPNGRALVRVDPAGETSRTVLSTPEYVKQCYYSVAANRAGSVVALAPADSSPNLANTVHAVDAGGTLTALSQDFFLNRSSVAIGMDDGHVVLWDRRAGKVVWFATE